MRATLLSITPKSEWRTFPSWLAGIDRLFIVTYGFRFPPAHIAEISLPSRQPIDCPLVCRLDRFDDPQRFFEELVCFVTISLLIVNLAKPFVAQSERGMVFGKSPLRQRERRLTHPQRFGETTPAAQHLQLIL